MMANCSVAQIILLILNVLFNKGICDINLRVYIDILN